MWKEIKFGGLAVRVGENFNYSQPILFLPVMRNGVVHAVAPRLASCT